MARVPLPKSRLRARRRRRRAFIALFAALILVAVGAGLVWLGNASFVRVQNVVVSGSSDVSAGDIEQYARAQMEGKYAWLFPRDNIFLYPRAAISQGLLAQYPTLRQADVHAKNFHTVEVIVVERQPVALWCPAAPQAEPCSYLDETGLAYEMAPQFSETPYIIYNGAVSTSTQPGVRQYLSQGAFQSLSALVAALGGTDAGPIRRVAVDTNNDAYVYFKNDFYIIFGLADDGGDVFNRFGLALQSSAFAGKDFSSFEYLDLRFGDKLYYKPK
jgi:hypothetical protein